LNWSASRAITFLQEAPNNRHAADDPLRGPPLNRNVSQIQGGGMPIREFELFHGAVLTKIVRSDQPMTLRMIETKPGESWSAYTVNGEITLILKHSTTPRRLKRVRGSSRWQFTLSVEQIQQLSGANSWLGLVCGSPKIGMKAPMEVCLLDPNDIDRLVDKSSRAPQPIFVKYLPGKSLRVSSPKSEEFVVPRKRLDTWEIPGS
jgi:hypothetical protein